MTHRSVQILLQDNLYGLVYQKDYYEVEKSSVEYVGPDGTCACTKCGHAYNIFDESFGWLEFDEEIYHDYYQVDKYSEEDLNAEETDCCSNLEWVTRSVKRGHSFMEIYQINPNAERSSQYLLVSEFSGNNIDDG